MTEWEDMSLEEKVEHLHANMLELIGFANALAARVGATTRGLQEAKATLKELAKSAGLPLAEGE